MQTGVSLVPHGGRAAAGDRANAPGVKMGILPEEPDGRSLIERILANTAAQRVAGEPPNTLGSPECVKDAEVEVEAGPVAASTPSLLRRVMENVDSARKSSARNVALHSTSIATFIADMSVDPASVRERAPTPSGGAVVVERDAIPKRQIAAGLTEPILANTAAKRVAREPPKTSGFTRVCCGC